jgi:SAP domain-containing new25/Domain of unknown function (DUF6434)
MPEVRPRLTIDLTAQEFERHYYLKAELIEFCREHGIPTVGNKPDLNERIKAFLETGEISRISSNTRRSSKNAREIELTLETVIWQGMTCNPRLGGFFKLQLGSGFRFNKAMRDFIHFGAGSTLAQALKVWHTDQAERKAGRKDEILPQLEYNQHFRAFFAEHKGATRAQAIAAWWAKRGKPKTD